ncbi:MAG: alkaline phosphatase D family protein, partial [Acidimicrobiales bacterium]|nr:alkaline phosphatase D family protein [Acidimicrobiales bacterium]
MSPTTPPPPGTGDVVAGAGPIGRRRFLALLGAAGAAVAVGGRLRPAGAQTPPVPNGYVVAWPDGVIAGDPTPDGTVLWTRVEPPAGAEPVPVTWEVAADDAFTSIVAGGVAVAESSADWTVKVPVTGLAADGWLHYRFLVGADAGPVGRLRTAPPAGTPTASLRFGFASCQQRGTERVAQRAASEEAGLDFFVHLGDYVYETTGDSSFQGGAKERAIEFDDEAGAIPLVGSNGSTYYAARSLDNYRQLYRTVRGDAALQAVHERLAMVAVWDDHEFSDDCWGSVATYHDGREDELDAARRSAANQAWFEYMPVDYADPGYTYDPAVAP